MWNYPTAAEGDRSRGDNSSLVVGVARRSVRYVTTDELWGNFTDRQSSSDLAHCPYVWKKKHVNGCVKFFGIVPLEKSVDAAPLIGTPTMVSECIDDRKEGVNAHRSGCGSWAPVVVSSVTPRMPPEMLLDLARSGVRSSSRQLFCHCAW